MENFDYSKAMVEAKSGKLAKSDLDKLLKFYAKFSGGYEANLVKGILLEQFKHMSDEALFKVIRSSRNERLLRLLWFSHGNKPYESQLEEIMIENYSYMVYFMDQPFDADTEKRFVDTTKTVGEFGINDRQCNLYHYIRKWPSKRLLISLLEAAKKYENADNLWAVNNCIVRLAEASYSKARKTPYLEVLPDIELQQQILDLHNPKTSLYLLTLFDFVNLPLPEIVQKLVQQKNTDALRFLLSHSALGENAALVMQEFPELEDEIVLSELAKWVVAYDSNPENDVLIWKDFLEEEEIDSLFYLRFNKGCFFMPTTFCARMYLNGKTPEVRQNIISDVQHFCETYDDVFDLPAFEEKVRKLKASCL